MNSKKIIFLIIFSITSNLTISKAYSTEECFENASRKIFNFNQGVDNYVLEPIAKGYNKLPKAVKTGTNNFTSNIATLLSIPNSILQGNLNQVGQSAPHSILETSALRYRAGYIACGRNRACRKRVPVFATTA